MRRRLMWPDTLEVVLLCSGEVKIETAGALNPWHHKDLIASETRY